MWVLVEHWTSHSLRLVHTSELISCSALVFTPFLLLLQQLPKIWLHKYMMSLKGPWSVKIETAKYLKVVELVGFNRCWVWPSFLPKVKITHGSSEFSVVPQDTSAHKFENHGYTACDCSILYTNKSYYLHCAAIAFSKLLLWRARPII